MVAPAIAAGHPEAVIVDRTTRGGRRLWYHLEVIQQPERARACGAGPKSSADRRPVDPPPVVELRIFEGPSMEHAKDITFTYNANFFLFATLEHARVIAHGRLQPPSAATPPVLTGMPVSGMAYLDRPKEAGYFLFPDLSVRHEGRYRLTFNLFEQTKEFADLDKENPDGAAHTPESFDWRMEVKSNDFMVFSAKKFPGLTESTALSRTVAEQGCRVRIRRDVRMRRREGKSSTSGVASSSGDALAKEEYVRRHRTQTPEVVADYRARSMSTESVSRTPFVPDANHAPRRPSMTDYHHSAAPSPQSGPSMPPGFGASSGGPHTTNSAHLRFGGNQPNAFAQPSSVPPSPTTYSTPTHSYAQPSQPQQPQQPPQHAQHHSTSSFSAPSPSPSHVNTASPPPNSSHSYYQDRPTSQHYTTAPPPAAAPAPSPKRESFDYHSRVSSKYTPAPLAIEPADDHRSDSRMISPAESKTLTLPSLSEMISFQDEKRQAPPPPPPSSHNHTTSPNSDRVPSLSQLLLPQPVLAHSSGPASQSAPSAPALQKKRSYGQYNNLDPVAEAYAANTAVKNHARQVEPPREHEYEQLWWKRADGSVWTAHGEVTR
ncbi:sexual development activator [Sporothrix brasiliensis 5110]|uniref:Sexual development activator n=1 Tax=Sporothrix brasiliensis 5110 TaxID=1398154 RepID=A0A0C2IXW9_9PEZI|nr:sexual development activator [Sporothrix brasiliensis 5110]KIH91580.1 sexual development activator [Sporothrix brasiliensis 5110]